MERRDRIPLEGTRNTRDLGGLVGWENRPIRHGLLFRSDCLARLTPADVRFLSEDLHLALDIDLRSREEQETKPDVPIPGCERLSIPVSSQIETLCFDCPEDMPQDDEDFRWNYARLKSLSARMDGSEGMQNQYLKYIYLDSNNEAYSEFISRVCSAPGPVIFHCADGKDRTGLAAVYILYILGVSREDILDDYAASARYLQEKVQRRRSHLAGLGITDGVLIDNLCLLATVKRKWMENLLREIDSSFGGMDNLLREHLHITDELIRSLRDKYLEG